MLDKKIQIIQQGDRFTMNLLEDGQLKSVLATDEDRGVVGHRWWLNPIGFDLAATLREWNCSEVQISQVYESLLSGNDTRLELPIGS